jgi:hypothetical protein
MNIAVIGWGSLIWCPRTLQIEPGWHKDGPMLPVEFARKSDDGRLALVIHPGSRKQRTYWANSRCESLCDAIENLRKREGKKCRTEDIHFVDKGGSGHRGDPKSVNVVQKWLMKMESLEAVIWTGLPGTYDRGSAIKYLKSLKDQAQQAKAKKYVRLTPPQIQTRVRAAMRKEGWTDGDLPADLFARDA